MTSAIQKIGTTGNFLKVLLICGIVASLLFVSTDILAGTLYTGYSFTNQAVSELFAIGAPTSHFVVPLFTLYSVLLAAFTLGIWMSACRNHATLKASSYQPTTPCQRKNYQRQKYTQRNLVRIKKLQADPTHGH